MTEWFARESSIAGVTGTSFQNQKWEAKPGTDAWKNMFNAKV